MEQNKNKRELETRLDGARRDKTKSLLKTAGWTTLPLAVSGAFGVFGQVVGSQFENQDLKTFIAYGIPFGAGIVMGTSGLIEDYIEKFKELVDEIKYASSRVREYNSLLRELK